jgi:hypothetical protein
VRLSKEGICYLLFARLVVLVVDLYNKDSTLVHNSTGTICEVIDLKVLSHLYSKFVADRIFVSLS